MRLTASYRLIPATILLLLGALFLARNLGIIVDWQPYREALRMLWPLALILAGVRLLLTRGDARRG